MLRQKMIAVFLASFIFFGCVGMQEPQGPAAAGASTGQPSGTAQPAAQEPACAVPEQHCTYDNVSQLLTCGSGYQIGGAAVANGSYYWVDKCQPISAKPNRLITLIGPFENQEEYGEYVAEGERLASGMRNASGENVSVMDIAEESSGVLFKGKPRGDYINFLFTASGTYPINNETTVDSVAKRLVQSMGGG